ncbi:hypothetical protein AB0E63_20220 [Kribbella sp. NPDC026596]|uniref:hypothetical protein n=1 Tax=Kribbella sp. NPDC026596 TaxID=3155122 RepID=UPI0033EA6244
MEATEELIAASLAMHAAEAPSDEHLLSGVHRRLRRRRTGRAIVAVVLACAAVATAITATHSLTTKLRSDPQVAPGWRWESDKAAQVQVPASWTQYISGPAPCTTFASYDGAWTEETRLVAGTKISVLTNDDALRGRILDSAGPLTGTDYYPVEPSSPPSPPPRSRSESTAHRKVHHPPAPRAAATPTGAPSSSPCTAAPIPTRSGSPPTPQAIPGLATGKAVRSSPSTASAVARYIASSDRIHRP